VKPRPAYVIVQTAVADYRREALRILHERLGDQLLLLCGDVYFKPSVITDHAALPAHRTIGNYFLLGRRFLLQPAAIIPGVRARVAVLELNPRIISVWIVAIIRRLLRRRTVLWGHAWSRNGVSSRSEPVRHTLRRTGHALLVYTEAERDELRKKMPHIQIHVAPNSVYTRAQLAESILEAEPRDFVWVGRMAEDKKPVLAVEGFGLLSAYVRPDSCPQPRLVFVGDGPNRSDAQDRVAALGCEARVVFVGWESRFEQLREIYSTAVCSLSTGYAGLSLTQSISFGIPMLIADDEPHAPEIEAAVPDLTAYFFQSDDARDLAAKMAWLWDRRHELRERRAAIRQLVFERYTCEAMAEGMIEAMEC
jgi:glycosyltransferase involved in cell wall biosynthesis